jgi:hypothetical protein
MKSKMKKYYVYIYRDPRTKLPFYVGKGCGDRMFKHLIETYKNTTNKKKYAIIVGLKRKGLVPIVGRYSKNLAEKDAYDLETKLILKYGRRDIDENGLLANVCIDNRPPGRNQPWTKEERQHLSEIRKGYNNPMFGRKLTQKHKNALANSKQFRGGHHSEEAKLGFIERNKRIHTGRKRSKQTKERISIALTGRKLSEEHRQKIIENRKNQIFSKETNLKRAITQTGKPRLSKKLKWIFFNVSTNISYETKSLSNFCKEHDIPEEGARKICKKIGKIFHGWKITRIVL